MERLHTNRRTAPYSALPGDCCAIDARTSEIETPWGSTTGALLAHGAQWCGWFELPQGDGVSLWNLAPASGGPWTGAECAHGAHCPLPPVVPVQSEHGPLNVTLATGKAGAALERQHDALIAADNLRESAGLHCLLADQPAGLLTPFGRAYLRPALTGAAA